MLNCLVNYFFREVTIKLEIVAMAKVPTITERL